MEEQKTCKMIEDATEIHCSECGCRMDDEIYFMFKRLEDDFKFCPCCGRLIVRREKQWKPIKDISYCASDCRYINCIHNKENISNNIVLHSWRIPEGIPDCPLGKSLFDMGEVLDNID